MALGLCLLGVFVGYVIAYTLQHTQPKAWENPTSIVVGILSAAVAGSAILFARQLGDQKTVDTFLSFYPVGLAYGALCTNAAWLIDPKNEKSAEPWIKGLYIIAIVTASILLLALLLYNPLRSHLPA